MGASVVMAAADVSGVVNGERVTVERGQRVPANHRFVRLVPDRFGDAEDARLTVDEVVERHGLEGVGEAHLCESCDYVAGNAGALGSHERSHEPADSETRAEDDSDA